MLYQLSYSRVTTPDPSLVRCNESRDVKKSERIQADCSFGHGGEGNRTPDLLNAIQALSQLSYAPGRCGYDNPAAFRNREVYPGVLMKSRKQP